MKMTKFFFQLKTRWKEGYGWDERLYIGYVEATDKKEAKAKMNYEFQENLREKFSEQARAEGQFKIYLVPSDPRYENFFLPLRKCTVCSQEYQILQQINLGESGANQQLCSNDCRRSRRPVLPDYFDTHGNGQEKPCIYKITNIKTGQSYIGKTTQPFTLRWYQHFFHPSETKFHQAIQEFSIVDWSFQVVEVMEMRTPEEDILKREQFWIDHFKTLTDGYNSTSAVRGNGDSIATDPNQIGLPNFEGN